MSTSTRAALLSIAAGAVLAGFTIGYLAAREPAPEPSTAPAPAASRNPFPEAPPPSPHSPPLTPTNDLQSSFKDLADSLPADVGVAVSAGDQAKTYGTWQSGAAWSTIKVPLSIAALRKDGIAAEPYVSLAITQSDNAAADRLWALLGAPTDASTAVQTVLIEAGDAGVTVQAQQVRPPIALTARLNGR